MRHIIITILLLTSIAQAKDIQPITKGSPAPYDGYVIDKEMEKSMRGKVTNLEAQVLNLKDLNTNAESRVDFHKKQAEEALTELRKEQIKGSISSVTWFLIGVGATSLAAYAAIRATK